MAPMRAIANKQLITINAVFEGEASIVVGPSVVASGVVVVLISVLGLVDTFAAVVGLVVVSVAIIVVV